MSHSTLENVVKILISTTALLFALLFGYYLVTKREQLQAYLGNYTDRNNTDYNTDYDTDRAL